MKRIISTGILCLILLVSLAVFAACGSRTAEEPALEPVEEFTAAVSNMRQARTVASVLGAFTNGTTDTTESAEADDSEEHHLAAHGHIDSPLDFGDVPTRSQFSIQIDSVVVDRQPMHEVTLLRPGLDITVYNNRDFYYIKGGLNLFGLPFPVVNLGIDGTVVSAKVPLLYDRYFAFDTDGIMDELMMDSFFTEIMQEFSQGFDQGFEQGLEIGYNLAAFVDAFDMEALLWGMLDDLLAVSQVEVNGGQYSLIIPADEATAALNTFWDAIVTAVEMFDTSFLDLEITEADFSELRDVLGELYFTQDVTLAYVLDNGNLMNIEFEGVLGMESDDEEVRILIAYANNSGDHVGDIAWVFEIESMNVFDTFTMRIEYTSTLDTTNGYARRDGFVLSFDDGWDEFDIALNWYLTRTADNRFSAGLELTIGENFESGGIYLFAQGTMAFGDDYFAFDLDRLGFDLDTPDASVKLLLSMSFRHEAVSAGAVPTISPADQFFVMDASDDELDSLLLQLEESLEGLMSMFDLFGF